MVHPKMQNKANTFNLNGVNYSVDDLTDAGRKTLNLLNDAQNELEKLENMKLLNQAAQQHLINQLKQMLPSPVDNRLQTEQVILGKPSNIVPQTEIEESSLSPAPFPENLPEIIKKTN